jgi:L-rhamnose mutarotase
MRFTELFEKYWDSLIIGIIAGIVLYYGLKIENIWQSAFYIFTRGLLLILIYTLFVWAGKKYNWNKKLIYFFSKIKLKQFNKKLLISCYFFLFSIAIFSTITLTLNSFKLLHPLFIVSSVLLSFVIIFILYIVQKNPKDILNNLSLLLLLITIFSISLIIYVSIPSDSKGINIEPLQAEFDFYIVNNEVSIENLQNYITKADKIWEKYNISITSKDINNVEINLSDRERNLLYTNISKSDTKEEIQKICDEEYMPIINSITNDLSNMSIIFIEGTGSSGRGHLCGHSFIIFRHEKNSWLDLTGWNLAHEIGHILGLSDLKNSYKVNLMNDKHKVFWKSSFLSQEQVDIIVKVIKNKTPLKEGGEI